MHPKFQNRSTFPSGRKVITSEEKRKKLNHEFNGHLSLPETNARANKSVLRATLALAQLSWAELSWAGLRLTNILSLFRLVTEAEITKSKGCPWVKTEMLNVQW